MKMCLFGNCCTKPTCTDVQYVTGPITGVAYGATGTSIAQCPTGTVVIGGSGITEDGFSPAVSKPFSDGVTTGWSVESVNLIGSEPLRIQATAICVPHCANCTMPTLSLLGLEKIAVIGPTPVMGQS